MINSKESLGVSTKKSRDRKRFLERSGRGVERIKRERKKLQGVIQKGAR